jgi:hypothetical protein
VARADTLHAGRLTAGEVPTARGRTGACGRQTGIGPRTGRQSSA